MNKAKQSFLFFISCLLGVFFSPSQSEAQTPTKCFEIESILVDACNATSLEPNNEMVRFKVGPAPINISNLIIASAPSSGIFQLNKWPTTTISFKGWIQNAVTASLTAALQATVQSTCGQLLEPPAGIIPAGAEVLIITSDTVSTVDNSFATLVGILYVIYHDEKSILPTAPGHFGNSGAGTRSFALIDNSLGCSDTVVYAPSLLIGGNGATANFAWPGAAIATYVNNGCQAPFIVNTANAGTGGSICPSGTISLSGSASGTYSGIIWQGGQGTFSTPTSLTTNYTAGGTDAGAITLSMGVIGYCNDTVFSQVTVTINPTPTLTSASSATICSGNAVNIPFSASVPSTYSWIATDNTNTTGESLIAQTATTLNNTIISSNTIAETVTYTVTPTSTTGLCPGTPQTISVTVDPTPTVTNSPLTQTICSGTNTALVNLTSDVAGTSFSWTASATSGITGFTASGTSTIPVQAISNSGSSAGTVTYAVTPSANGCSGVVTNYTIIITPKDNASFTYSSPTYCQTGSNPFPVITGLNGGVFSSTAGLIINSGTGEIDLAGSTLGSYAITYGVNSVCPDSSVFNITLTNAPNASFSYNGPYCQDGTNPSPTFAIGASAGIFSAGPAGLIFINTSTGQIDLTASAPGTYTVTDSIPAAGGCAIALATNTVTINPIPTITNTPLTETICSGSNTNISLTSGIIGTSFDYTASNTSGIVTGFTTSATGVSSINDILTNNTSSTGTITYVVTPKTALCTGIPVNYVVTVDPIPTVTNTPLTETICSGGTTIPVTLTSDVTGATFAWTAVGTGSVTGFTSNGTNTIPAQTITNTGIAVETVTYSVTPSANSCIGTPVNYVVTVDPPINITASNNTPICEGNTILLSTAAITGATYNWTGPNSFSSADQNPIITNATPAMSGTFSLTITMGNCNSTIGTTIVQVNPGAIASFSANPLSGSAPFTVNFTNNSQNATSYFWDFGNTTTNTSTNPTETYPLIGTYTVVLIASTNSQCPDTTEVTITVYDNFTLVIPNVFTPNGDGKNDVFFITGSGIKEFECSVFDRWGLKLKQINDINIGWDGRTDSGIYTCDGTYYYMIKVTGYDNNPIEKNGFIMLVK